MPLDYRIVDVTRKNILWKDLFDKGIINCTVEYPLGGEGEASISRVNVYESEGSLCLTYPPTEAGTLPASNAKISKKLYGKYDLMYNRIGFEGNFKWYSDSHSVYIYIDLAVSDGSTEYSYGFLLQYVWDDKYFQVYIKTSGGYVAVPTRLYNDEDIWHKFKVEADIPNKKYSYKHIDNIDFYPDVNLPYTSSATRRYVKCSLELRQESTGLASIPIYLENLRLYGVV